MLLTPAPALAMASSDSGISISCMDAERTIIASGFSMSSPYAYFAVSNLSRPTLEILFNVLMLNIVFTSVKNKS